MAFRRQSEQSYENEELAHHIAQAGHVLLEKSHLDEELRQLTYRSFVFGCFVLFLTLVQALHVWEGEILPMTHLSMGASPHPERTLLKVVSVHEQTIALQWVFGFEMTLVFLCWLQRLTNSFRAPLTARRIQFLLLFSGCCGIFHVGAFGVRMYALWLVHLSWVGVLSAFLDLLWMLINWSTFFTLTQVLQSKHYAQHLINVDISKFGSAR